MKTPKIYLESIGLFELSLMDIEELKVEIVKCGPGHERFTIGKRRQEYK